MKCHKQTEGKERIKNSVFCGEHLLNLCLCFGFVKLTLEGGNYYDSVKLSFLFLSCLCLTIFSLIVWPSFLYSTPKPIY